jgi:uncharacterized protein
MSDHLFETKVVEFRQKPFDNPIIFGGFVGPGLVGLVTMGYMIEKLNLQEIAHVQSEHIPPVVVFVSAKLRNPFRIYSDPEGRILAMVCEMPIDIKGMYEISSVLLGYAEKVRAKEIVILDGVPVSGVVQDRKAWSVADDGRTKELEQKGVGPISTALISGIGGAILNQCLTRRISGVSLLTSVSVDIPDPGASLELTKAINQIYGLGIGTEELEENVQRINARLNELAQQYSALGQQQQSRDKPFYS